MISFGTLPDEILFSTFAELIPSRDFPKSLVRMSQTSIRMNTIAKDAALWRHAIAFYFPVALKQTTDHPLALFKLLFERVSLILKRENLTFSDYAGFLLHQGELSAEKQDVVIGLCVAAGQKMVFSPTQIAQSKNALLVFSASLNNYGTLVQALSQPIPPHNECKRSALLLASEYGFLPICGYLISHHRASLDRATISESFIKSCEQGHIGIAQLFLNPLTAPALTFSLTKGLHIVCAKGYTEITTALLKNAHLYNNLLALTEATRIAARSEQLGPLTALLQDKGITKNVVLMIDILKLAVQKRNKDMLALILENQEIKFSLTVLLEVIQCLIDSEECDTACFIVKSRFANIPIYARRKIFYSAAEKGLLKLIEFLVENDTASFDSYTFKQGMQLARMNQHEAVSEYLTTKNKAHIKPKPSLSLARIPRTQSNECELDRLEDNFAMLSIDATYVAQFTGTKRNTKEEDAKMNEGFARKPNLGVQKINF